MTIKKTLKGTLTYVLFMMVVTLLPVDVMYAQDTPAVEGGVEEASEKTFAELGGDSGDTAWMIVATILVIVMAIPGLALLYGGLVRSKNMLSVLMQVFATFSLMSVLWVIYVYSVAFSDGAGTPWG